MKTELQKRIALQNELVLFLRKIIQESEGPELPHSWLGHEDFLTASDLLSRLEKYPGVI